MNDEHASRPSDAGSALRSALSALRMGPAQRHGPITIVPLHLPGDAGPDYLGLDEATASGRFRVTEVSPAGSVPQLWAANEGDRPVLLLDGEELAGAKQNRALNATLLLPAGFSGKIPVSCTEQGRWRHTSAQFSSSEIVMEMKTRRRKSSSVSDSLASSAGYHSDQGQVWSSISELQAKAGLRSPTAAMRDVFQAHAARLAEAIAAFPVQPDQHGLLVFLSGRPAGLDVVSRARVYARLHPKLVRSYVLDALLRPGNGTEPPPPDAATAFLARVGEGGFRCHPGVGLGESLRTLGQGPVGGALVCDAQLIHAAFFAEGTAPDLPAASGGMQSLRGRSRHAGDGHGHGHGHDHEGPPAE